MKSPFLSDSSHISGAQPRVAAGCSVATVDLGCFLHHKLLLDYVLSEVRLKEILLALQVTQQ